jgi:DNA-binding NtrC family response regulator
LFLDEIGNIPLHLQAKLLTVLEQRSVTPLGGNQVIDIDVRVIAATNISREALRDENKFRQDLLFRLNTVEIILPPLRERPEDIPEIATHYAQLYSRKYQKKEKKLSRRALEAAMAYHWPGNVRALRHAVERAVILSESEELEAADLQLEAYGMPVNKSVGNGGLIREQPGLAEIDDGADLDLERMEKRMVEAALKRHRYNISKAAKELGITRAALYRRMEKYGL